MKIPDISTYDGWCSELIKHIAKFGVPADQVRGHMEVEPDWYKEAFDDGMFPDQAAKFASDLLR